MKKPCIRTRNRRPGGNKGKKGGLPTTPLSAHNQLISPLNGHVAASAFTNHMPLFTYPQEDHVDPSCQAVGSPYLKPDLGPHLKLPFHFPGVVQQFQHDGGNIGEGITAINPVSPMDYKPNFSLQYDINN